MCFHSKQTKLALEVENRFNAKIEKKELFQSQENINELIVTFNIPENTQYFTLRDNSNQNNVTLDIINIQSKNFALSKKYQNLENKYNSYFDDIYIDLTLNKYIIKRKGTKLKAVDKKQSYSGNLFLN